MKHTKDYLIEKTENHIKKKEKILKNIIWADMDCSSMEVIQQHHRLSKAKVHCSCPMCTEKVSNLGWKYKDRINLSKGDDKTEAEYIPSAQLSSRVKKDTLVYSTKNNK